MKRASKFCRVRPNLADRQLKFWLSKSLTHFIADGDASEKMICRIPAWLYYKSGLDKFFPVERWSQAAI